MCGEFRATRWREPQMELGPDFVRSQRWQKHLTSYQIELHTHFVSASNARKGSTAPDVLFSALPKHTTSVHSKLVHGLVHAHNGYLSTLSTEEGQSRGCGSK